ILGYAASSDPYKLKVRALAPIDPSSAAPLNADEEVRGTLSGEGTYALYRFHGHEGDDYSFTLNSRLPDGISVELMTLDGRRVPNFYLHENDWGEWVVPADGDYLLRVMPSDPSESGDYTISSYVIPDDYSN